MVARRRLGGCDDFIRGARLAKVYLEFCGGGPVVQGADFLDEAFDT